MLLAVHIFFAVGSLLLMGIAVAGRIYDKSRNFDKFVQLSKASFVGLLVTGTVLALVYHLSVESVCLSGLAYLGGLVALYLLYRRLAASASE